MTNEKRGKAVIVVAAVHSTKKITDELEKIVANLEDLNAAADAIAAEVDEAVTAINDLREQVASGDGISQEDLDAVSAKLSAATDRLKAAREGNADDQPHPDHTLPGDLK